MNLNIKKLIEQIVDIKKQISSILILGLIFLFPLNQQYHFRPFPSVDGIIIDYLITKISIVELILISIFFLNLREIFLSLRSYFKTWIFPTFVSILLISIYQSNYLFLALYENLILLILISLGVLFYKNPQLINLNLLSKSIKFWVLFLSILGFSQFYMQKSVFNNYAVFGEFPYTEDYYHIKQKNIFFESSIPPYAIFSHTNIFGAYLIFLLFLLNLIQKDSKFFSILIFFDLILVGSVACLLAFILYLISLKMPSKALKFLFKILVPLVLGIYFLYSFRYPDYKNDFSIYRRLYMFDLSSNFFIENPQSLIIGSGYYNYFSLIKSELYKYELVRFFQPPHFLPLFLIWQYGILILFWFGFVFWSQRKNLNLNLLRFLLIITILGSFDHYLVSNHQLKVLIMLIIPYSLKQKNGI